MGKRISRCLIGVAAAALNICIGAWVGLAADVKAKTAESAWAALQQGGHIVLVRRVEIAGQDGPPGNGDQECNSQGILSPGGVARAERIGDAFHDRGVAVEAVYASQWCAAANTAASLDLGPVRPFPALNSFATQPERKTAQMAALVPWISNAATEGILVLVTHQGVVTELTDLVLSEGELVVIKPLGGGEIQVVGRIAPF